MPRTALASLLAGGTGTSIPERTWDGAAVFLTMTLTLFFVIGLLMLVGFFLQNAHSVFLLLGIIMTAGSLVLFGFLATVGALTLRENTDAGIRDLVYSNCRTWLSGASSQDIDACARAGYHSVTGKILPDTYAGGVG